MKIIVCMKQVPATSQVEIDPETGAVQDFVLECRDEVPGVVNLVGIESPGLASALPLARRAVALIAQREKL